MQGARSCGSTIFLRHAAGKSSLASVIALIGITGCHHPRKRVIQYAAASRFLAKFPGILDRPVIKPGDDNRGTMEPDRPLRD